MSTETKTTFTKGPWKVRTAGGHPYAINAIDRGVISWGGFIKPAKPESLANAHLIAAAPSMHAFVVAVRADASAYQWHAAADALLAKAEGRA